jgi:alpha-acetolactate decarboxylase
MKRVVAMHEWKQCSDTAHENEPCGFCSGSMGMDLRDPGYHWHFVYNGTSATAFHAKCKPPEPPTGAATHWSK